MKGEKQMNEIQTSCASTDRKWNTWESIDWNKCEMAVNKLQARIVKAQKAGKHGRVKALQWVLTHSFYAKALAVKRVTSNRGSDTAGVDKVKWSTPKARFKAIGELKRGGYKPQPLKRVNIKKSNGKLRPLGIPTMKDRAMQALYLLALEPVSETTADSNSYGFRKERSTGDAREQCFCVLAKKASPEWTEYFEKRKTYKMLQSLNGRKSLLYMWERQNHLCPVCGKPIDKKHPWGTSQQIVNGKKVNFLLHDSCRRKVIQTKKM